LLVVRGEDVQGMLPGRAFLDDAGRAVDADPPEPVPVLLVVVGEQRDPRILADVADPAEVGRGLRLVIDRDVDLGAVDRESY
jgi:hypothetical protein